jgi:hypothetical protein
MTFTGDDGLAAKVCAKASATATRTAGPAGTKVSEAAATATANLDDSSCACR